MLKKLLLAMKLSLRNFQYRTCPPYQCYYTILHYTIAGVGKEGRTTIGPIVLPEKAAPFARTASGTPGPVPAHSA